MAGAAELIETATPNAGTVVDSEQPIESCCLVAEVCPVEFDVDSKGFVEVASSARLNVVAGRPVVVRTADGESEATTNIEGVLRRAVGVSAAVVVVGSAVFAAGRGLVGGAAEVEALGVSHFFATGTA